MSLCPNVRPDPSRGPGGAGVGAVAYIEAEFFGGSGAQAHVLISEDGTDAGVKVSDDAINDALAWLGVQACDGKDWFDAVGLGKHRETDGWLASCDR